MAGPARRSRRTRNEPPEIVPPKSDEEREDDDQEGDEDDEEDAKDDEEDAHEDKAEKSDIESPDHGRSKQSSPSKINKKAETAQTGRRSKRSRKPTSRAARAASDAPKGRRRRRASNSSDDQRSKDGDDASSGGGSEGGGEEEVNQQQQAEPPAKSTSSRGRARKSRPSRRTPSAKSADEGSKGGGVPSDSDEDEDNHAGKDAPGDESDQTSGSNDSKSKDDAPSGEAEKEDSEENSSDNEPLSVMLKRKREALKKEEGNDKTSSAAESNEGDDQSEAEQPKKPLSAAASGEDNQDDDEEQGSDADSSKKGGSRSKRVRKARLGKRGGVTRSSGDEGDTGEPPEKRPKRRGRPRKGISNQTTEKETPDEGSSDESAKGEKPQRGRPRKVVASQTKEKDTSVAGTNDEGSSDDSVKKDQRGRGRPRKTTASQTKDKVTPASGSNEEHSSDESVKKEKRGRGRPRKAAVGQSKDKATPASTANDEHSSDESANEEKRGRRRTRKVVARKREEKDTSAAGVNDEESSDDSVKEEKRGRGKLRKAVSSEPKGDDATQTDVKNGHQDTDEQPITRQARSRSNSTAADIGSGEEKASEADSSHRSRRSRRKRKKPYKLGEEDASGDEHEATKVDATEAEVPIDKGGGRGHKRKLDVAPGDNGPEEDLSSSQKKSKNPDSEESDVEMETGEHVGEVGSERDADSTADDLKAKISKEQHGKEEDDKVSEMVKEGHDKKDTAAVVEIEESEGSSRHEEADAERADSVTKIGNEDSEDEKEIVLEEAHDQANIAKEESDKIDTANDEKSSASPETEDSPSVVREGAMASGDSSSAVTPGAGDTQANTLDKSSDTNVVDSSEFCDGSPEEVLHNKISSVTKPLDSEGHEKVAPRLGDTKETDLASQVETLTKRDQIDPEVRTPVILSDSTQIVPEDETKDSATRDTPSVTGDKPRDSSNESPPSIALPGNQDGIHTDPATSDREEIARSRGGEIERSTITSPEPKEINEVHPTESSNRGLDPPSKMHAARPATDSLAGSSADAPIPSQQPVHTTNEKDEDNVSVEQDNHIGTETTKPSTISPENEPTGLDQRKKTEEIVETTEPVPAAKKTDKENDDDQFHDAHMEFPLEPPTSSEQNKCAPPQTTKSLVEGNSGQALSMMKDEKRGEDGSKLSTNDSDILKATMGKDVTNQDLAGNADEPSHSAETSGGLASAKSVPEETSNFRGSSKAVLDDALSSQSHGTDHAQTEEAASQFSQNRSAETSDANKAINSSTDDMEVDAVKPSKVVASEEAPQVPARASDKSQIAKRADRGPTDKAKHGDMDSPTATERKDTAPQGVSVSNMKTLESSNLQTDQTTLEKVGSAKVPQAEQSAQSVPVLKIMDGEGVQEKDAPAAMKSISVDMAANNATSRATLSTGLDKTSNCAITTGNAQNSDQAVAQDHSKPDTIPTDNGARQSEPADRQEQNDHTSSTLIDARQKPSQLPAYRDIKALGTYGDAAPLDERKITGATAAYKVHGNIVTSRKIPVPIKSTSELLSIPFDIGYKVKFGPPIPSEPQSSNTSSVSRMDLVDKDKLKRVKTVLYAAGSKVHRGSGLERIFAEYWDAMALRLSDRLSSHTSARCQNAIDNFLKTAKLRKLHNKFIMKIMSRSTRSVATYDEIKVHLPVKWQKRVGKVVVQQSASKREAQQNADFSLSEPITFSAAEPCYREAWDHHLSDPKPLGNEQRRQKTLLSPKAEIASSSIPGALVVDPVVRKIAQQSEMQVSEIAIWLMAVAVKEHSTNVLRAAISQKEAIAQGELATPVLKFPKVLAVAAKMGSKKDLSQDPATSIILEKGSNQTPRKLTALDVYAGSAMMPFGSIGSVGGSVSRNVLERSLHVSYDSLPVVPDDDFVHVQHFVTDQIRAEARTRTVPPKAREDERDSRPPENHENATSTMYPAKHQNSFAVPPPAPAQPRKIEAPVAPQVQQRPVPTQQVDGNANVPTPSEDGDKALPRGLGRGAKNLAALMQRTSTSTPPAGQDDDTKKGGTGTSNNASPSEVKQAESTLGSAPEATPNEAPEVNEVNEETDDGTGQRRGKGFGIKNLAAMRARASNKN